MELRPIGTVDRIEGAPVAAVSMDGTVGRNKKADPEAAPSGPARTVVVRRRAVALSGPRPDGG